MALTGPEALAAELVLLIVAGLFLLLRLYTRIYVLGQFGAPDALLIVAWLCLMINDVGDLYSYRWGLWSPEIVYSWANGHTVLPVFESVITDKDLLVKALKLQYAFAIFMPISGYCIKMSFCVWYFTLFPPIMTKLRKALWFVIVYTTIVTIVFILLCLFFCVPVSSNWAVSKEDRCISIVNGPSYIFGSFNLLFTEILTVALPFFLLPAIKRSNPGRLKLAGIILIFCVGLISILATLIRILSVGSGSTTQRVMVWISGEVSSGIIAASLPPLRSLGAGRKHGAPAVIVDGKECDGHPETIGGGGRVVGLTRGRWGSEESKDIPDMETAGVTNWTAGTFYAEETLDINDGGLGPRNRNPSGATDGTGANTVTEHIGPLENPGALNTNSQNWRNRWLVRHGSLKSKDGRKGSDASLAVMTFGGGSSIGGHSAAGFHPATPGLRADFNYSYDRRPSAVSVAEQSDAYSYYHRPSVPALVGLSAPPSNLNSPTHQSYSQPYNPHTIGGGMSNSLNRRSLNAGFGFLNFWGRDSGGPGTNGLASGRTSRRFSSTFGEGGLTTPTLGSPSDIISSGFSDSISDLGRTLGSDSDDRRGRGRSLTAGSSSFTGYGSSNVGSSGGNRRSVSPHTFQPPPRTFGGINRDSFGTSIFGTSV